jgi:ribosomal protein L21E
MESFEIKFRVTNTDPTIPLQLQVCMDDQTLDSVTVTDVKHCAYNVTLSDGDHELKLIMRGKTTDHTVLDPQGEIITDAMLQFTNIELDEINIDAMIQSLAVYTHDFNGTGGQVHEQFYLAMGCNGTASLKFTTPVYLWLLETM